MPKGEKLEFLTQKMLRMRQGANPYLGILSVFYVLRKGVGVMAAGGFLGIMRSLDGLTCALHVIGRAGMRSGPYWLKVNLVPMGKSQAGRGS